MFFKTTLYHSNPRVIREFYIEDNRTLKELLEVVAIIHGWERDTDLNLYYEQPDEEKPFFAGSDPLDQVFNAAVREQNLYFSIRLPMEEIRRQYSYYWSNDTFGDLTDWIFELSIEDKDPESVTDPDFLTDQPYLLHFRGYHPFPSCVSMKEWNSIHKRFIAGYDGNSINIGNVERMAYVVNQKRVNLRLKQVISQHLPEVKIDKSRTKCLEDVLNSYRVDDLKWMIRDNGFSINYNQRKQQVIDEMVSYYKEYGIFERALLEMGDQEYQSFKSLCTFNNTDYKTANTLSFFPVLRSYGLIMEDSYAHMVLADGLVDYYGIYLMQNGENLLLEKMKWNNVLKVALRFYGVFSKSLAKKLAYVMYPDELDPDGIDTIWRAGNRREFYTDDFLYNSGELSYRYVQQIFAQRNSGKVTNYYMLSKDMAFEVLNGTLSYPEGTDENLRQILSYCKSNYSYSASGINVIIQYIYMQTHYGNSAMRIVYDVQNIYRLWLSKNDSDKMEKEIKRLKPYVRLISLNGFTQKEVNKE